MSPGRSGVGTLTGLALRRASMTARAARPRIENALRYGKVGARTPSSADRGRPRPQSADRQETSAKTRRIPALPPLDSFRDSLVLVRAPRTPSSTKRPIGRGPRQTAKNPRHLDRTKAFGTASCSSAKRPIGSRPRPRAKNSCHRDRSTAFATASRSSAKRRTVGRQALSAVRPVVPDCALPSPVLAREGPGGMAKLRLRARQAMHGASTYGL